MSDIICDCGHGIEEHEIAGAENGATCNHVVGRHIVGDSRSAYCRCRLNCDTVEARYWARRMFVERDKLKARLYDQGVELNKARNNYVRACVKLSDHRKESMEQQDTIMDLRGKLNRAIEALKEARNMSGSNPRLANVVIPALYELEEKW